MNHYNAVPAQLADGIRGLNYDVYLVDGALILFHGIQELGEQPFDEALSEISDFLLDNPDEVVLLDLQKGAPDADLVVEFEAHALGDYLHAHTPGEPWATLGEMIESGERLLLSAPDVEDVPPWFHDTGEIIYGPHYAAEEPEDLGCVLDGEVIEGGLLTLNHFLTSPIASAALADSVNHNPFLLDRAERCQEELGTLPNAVVVDYYSLGDVVEAVAVLNGVGEAE
jgi:hypothetical protein